MNKLLDKVLAGLREVNGLANFRVLSEKEKKKLLSLAEENNLGVKEALTRKHTIAFTHDVSFREPAGEVVKKQGNSIIFPPVPFPEVNAKDVVSACPGWKADSWLRPKLGNPSPAYAILLVGFNG